MLSCRTLPKLFKKSRTRLPAAPSNAWSALIWSAVPARFGPAPPAAPSSTYIAFASGLAPPPPLPPATGSALVARPLNPPPPEISTILVSAAASAILPTILTSPLTHAANPAVSPLVAPIPAPSNATLVAARRAPPSFPAGNALAAGPMSTGTAPTDAHHY